jgi:phosphate-selective porin OprO/OprP
MNYITLAALLATTYAYAGTATTPATPTAQAAWGDNLWKNAILWEDPESYWFQKVRAILRYHANYAYVQEDDLGGAGDFETRRLRFGINTEFLQQFEFRNEWNSTGWDDDDFDPQISNIDTLYLSWKPSNAFNWTIGKHKSPITQEFRWSSNELETIERTVATQSFIAIERHWGTSFRGELGRWSYITGIWAGSFEGEYNESFDSDAAKFFLASVSYDFGAKDQAWQKALLNLQYVYTTATTDIAPRFDNILSLNFEGKHGPWGISTDHLLGWGEKNAYGMYIQPSYFLTKQLQLVTRYSFGDGDADTFSNRARYEQLVTASGAGDHYQSFYAGLNYYIYGHKLKLMAGAEYLNLKDSARNGGAFKGWTALTGLVFWF